jgi:hypothetical protein
MRQTESIGKDTSEHHRRDYTIYALATNDPDSVAQTKQPL